MKPSEVLKQLKELKETWRKQGFSYTIEQQAEYERLRQLRYKRVAYFRENDLVWKGLSKQVDVSK
tara:strand:+ start:1216 stop:1410 length:195 start_codon:yes stop_codon:yes gene_type:complete